MFEKKSLANVIFSAVLKMLNQIAEIIFKFLNEYYEN